MTLEVRRYEPAFRPLWDDFGRRSKNGVFLFHRDYMDYHADRFADSSVLFFEGQKLLAVMPASLRDGVLTSHGGLTFGGVLSDERMRTPTMVSLFESLKAYLRGQGVAR